MKSEIHSDNALNLSLIRANFVTEKVTASCVLCSAKYLLPHKTTCPDWLSGVIFSEVENHKKHLDE